MSKFLSEKQKDRQTDREETTCICPRSIHLGGIKKYRSTSNFVWLTGQSIISFDYFQKK